MGLSRNVERKGESSLILRNRKKLFNLRTLYFLLVVMLIPSSGLAMHIGEGYLPIPHALAYFALTAPFFIKGIKDIKKKTEKDKNAKMFIALAGAYCFLLSALKLPSVTGSCSHPTGVGFGAIILGPFIMSVLGTLVLLFQAVFLSHGGLTTLGANAFSMAVVGPIIAFIAYRALRNRNKNVAIFVAAFLADLLTYVVTTVQLSMAFQSPTGGLIESMKAIGAVFATTQIPLAIAEGILTVFLFNIVEKYSKSDMEKIMEVQYSEN